MNKHVYVDLLKKSIETHRNLPCLHIKAKEGYRTWTYEDFKRDLNRMVSALKQAGFTEGQNGVVIGENTPEWLISYFSIILAGGCTVPVDPNLSQEEIAEIVRQTDPKVVFCSPVYAGLFTKLKEETLGIERVVLINTNGEKNNKNFSGFIADGDDKEDAFRREFKPEDPMVILFTSGTTGKAKGVVLNQRNYTSCPLYGIPRMQVSSKDTIIAILPLHHVFGFAACIAAPLIAGMDIVFIPMIKGPLIVEGLNDKKVSMLPAVPQMLELFYDNIERKVAAKGAVVKIVFGVLKFLSKVLGPVFGMPFRKRLFSTVHAGFGGNLNLLISGGSSIKMKQFRGFREMGFNIVEGYGLTETFGPITLCAINDPRQASVGTVFPENEMKINNPNEEGIGEVLFRGATVFPGYYKNSEETQKVFDKEGWFYTGDLGRVTKDGFLYLTGRIKDIIVLESGKNVYPDDLEEFYSKLPVIEEIGIFGVQENGKEIIAAAVLPSAEVRRRNSPEQVNEIVSKKIKEFMKSLPSYKRINDFVIVPGPLPRTTTKKIKKPELKEIFQTLKGSNAIQELADIKLTHKESELIQTAEYGEMLNIIKQLSKELDVTKVNPRSNLEFDLMLDSLKQIELVSLVESRFNIAVPEEALIKVETLGDAVALVQDIQAASGKKDKKDVRTVKDRLAQGLGESEIRDNKSILFHIAPSFLNPLYKLFWNLRIEGKENLVQDRPVIFASNHESYLDIFWILCALPWPIRRKTYTIGKVEILKYPFLPFLLKRLNMIAVERDGDVLSALQTAHSVIQQGKNLALFPEGTRTRTGKMGEFKTGIGMLMDKTGVDVIPIRVKHSYEIWPPGRLPRLIGARAKVPIVTFGKPVSLNGLLDEGRVATDKDTDQIAGTLKDIISSM